MSLYASARLAAAYAFDRPPVHERLLDAVALRLGVDSRFLRGLDIGCGAGLSTAALARLAERAVGLEPVAAMLAHSRAVAPRAVFVIGEGERLPFGPATFDVVTAAGAINYADRELWIPEVARVLTAAGVLIIYDFSVGRRLRDRPALEQWHARFEQRYPSPPGYELDVRALPFERSGLRLTAYEESTIAIPMDLESYLRYVSSETRVELALSRGDSEQRIRHWCEQGLAPIFREEVADVLFDAYTAYVRPAAARSPTP